MPFTEVLPGYPSVHSALLLNSEPSSHCNHASYPDDIPPGHELGCIICCHCGLKRFFVKNCGSRLCPYCRKKVVFKTLSRKGLLDGRIRGLRFMTLTIKSVPELNHQVVDMIRGYWRRLIRRKLFKKYVQGGMYVIEVTKTSKGYHIHIHCVYIGSYFPYMELRRIWKQITSGSYICWISRCKDSSAVFAYMAKYMTKTDLGGIESSEYLAVFKGIKLLQCFGLWTKLKKIKEVYCCSNCHFSDWMPMDYLNVLLMKDVQPGWQQLHPLGFFDTFPDSMRHRFKA